jgi:uncharacterized protein (DUF58 family)
MCRPSSGRGSTDLERRHAALLLAAVAGLIAIGWGAFVVLLWAAAIGTIALAAEWWARVAWRGVSVEVEIEPARAFAGEDIAIRLAIRNEKRVPLPIVRVGLSLPEGLLPSAEIGPMAYRGHRRRLSIRGRSEVTLRLPVVAPQRGEYWLEPIDVDLADPFDLSPIRRSMEVDRPLLVMPEPAFGMPLRVRRSLPFGAPAPAAHLFEDREHFAGVRDYEPGDPMHHVHWRLSAHAGRLQTKKFDPTRSAEVIFALDVAHGEPFWLSVDDALAEETIGWASYAARQAIAAGWRVGLVANTHLRKGRGPLRIAPATSAGQESVLFTALARMPNQPTNDLAPVLREVGRRMVRRTTVLVLSPEPGDSLRYEMEVLRRRGADVVHVSPLEGRRS